MRARLVVIVWACLATSGLAQDGSDAGLWLTAKVVEEGASRTVYFGGRGELPAGTNVDVFLRRKGEIFEAARAIVGRKDESFNTARVALGGMPAAELDFANRIGPLAQMVAGEWELYAIAKTEEGNFTALFPLIVGDPAAAADDEAAEATRLLAILDTLEALLNRTRELKAEFESVEVWSPDVEARWLEKSRAIQGGLQGMSNQALGERARVLAPIFPFVNMVLTQMPLKTIDLVNGFYAYHQYRTVEKGAPGGFDLSVASAIDKEVSTHIELSRRQLATRDATHVAAFYADFSKLESLLAELLRSHRRAMAQSSFKAVQWNGLAANADGVHAIVAKRLARYRAGEVGKEAPEVVDALDGALDLTHRLVGLLTQDLYTHHGTPKDERIPLEAELPAGVANTAELRVKLEKLLDTIRAFASRAREAMRTQILARIGEVNADVYMALERAEAVGADTAEFEKAMFEMRHRNEERKFGEDPDSTTYWPGVYPLLEALCIDVATAASELAEIAKGSFVEKLEVRGTVIELDRRVQLSIHTNNILRVNALLQRALEFRDEALLQKVSAWMTRRGIEIDPIAQGEVDAVAKLPLPEERR